MVQLEQIAVAILRGDALGARSLVQDWTNTPLEQRDSRRPQTHDKQVLAVAASIAELLAERSGQMPPEWTKSVAPLAEPLFLVRAARTMPRMRTHCERETPAPLRKRRLFAPPNYLSFV